MPVTDFAEQRAVVMDSATGRYGYINTKGVVAIPANMHPPEICRVV